MTLDRPGGDWVGIVKKVMVPGPPDIEVCCPKCEHQFVVVEGGPVRIHVIMNRDADGAVREVFIHNAPAGTRAVVNGLCRLVSKALQEGVPTADIVKMLRSQHEGYPPVRWPGVEGAVVSLPDALARLLGDTIPALPDA